MFTRINGCSLPASLRTAQHASLPALRTLCTNRLTAATAECWTYVHYGTFKWLKMDCRVCGRPNASQYNHYGSHFICHSCRGFFYRAVQSSTFKLFQHKAGSDCVIESVGRKSCKKCRFDKCLKVGMRVSFVTSVQSKYIKLS